MFSISFRNNNCQQHEGDYYKYTVGVEQVKSLILSHAQPIFKIILKTFSLKKSMLQDKPSWVSRKELVIKLWLITAFLYLNSLQAHFLLKFIYFLKFSFFLTDLWIVLLNLLNLGIFSEEPLC